MRSPFTLRIRCVRSAAVRAFLPMNAKPLQISDHGVDEFRLRPLRVEVFVAQNEGPGVRSGSLRRDPEGSGMAEMKQAIRARGKAEDGRH